MGIKRVAALSCVAGAILLAAPLARAQDGAWMRAESENFIVYSRGRERPLRDAVQSLEHFNELLYAVTSASRSEAPKVSIYLLEGEQALRIVRPNAHENLGGYYTYRPEFVAAFAIYDDRGWEGGARRILFHEYTHHFMMQYFRAAYPTWYVEGFAEYMSTAEFERGRAMVGRPSPSRATQLYENRARLLPMRVMLGALPEETEARSMFYAQSWLMVHYMFSRPERQRAFNAYMRALGQGEDPAQAFEAAFGVPLNEFPGVLSQYMGGSIPVTVYPNRELADADIAVSRMPRSANNLLLLNARLLHSDGDTAQLADQIVAEAAQFPGDGYAARSAAYAELTRNPTRARELAAPLAESNADDFEAQYIIGRSYFEEAEASGDGGEEAMAQARRHFVRAFRANASHVPTLYYYVRAHNAYPMPEQVLDVLIQAHLLAPQVDEIRFNLAIQLLNARRFEDAAMVLRPLAYNPHGGETADRARRYLEAAQRNEMPEW